VAVRSKHNGSNSKDNETANGGKQGEPDRFLSVHVNFSSEEALLP
jgi:hypothetical protein